MLAEKVSVCLAGHWFVPNWVWELLSWTFISILFFFLFFFLSFFLFIFFLCVCVLSVRFNNKINKNIIIIYFKYQAKGNATDMP